MDVVSNYRYTRGNPIDGGEGQNSIGVFEAFDPQLQTTIAVKEIAKTQFRDPTEYFQEAQRMFRAGHPNVVSIRTATEQADRVCLGMPLYTRGSLAKRIETRPLSIREVLAIGRQILAGIGSIHAAGTVHFDIKPSNVLFSDDGVAMVADFGQAREVGPHGVTLMPNRMYGGGIPPEAFTNARRGTFESDIFQAGLTLWRACNGKEVYDQEALRCASDLRRQIEEGKFPRRDLFLPHVPDRFRRAIRKSLQVNPSDRFPSAREFANALSTVDCAYDWRCECQPNGETTWFGENDDAAPLRIVLHPDGKQWSVSIFTRTGGKDRKSRRPMWKGNLTRSEALKYARNLIATLG